ncbi:MAG: hypothetical protein ABIK60_00195 [candidate division WOR-3 bacterium]
MKKIIFFVIFFIFCQKKNIFEDDKELVKQFLKENKEIISIYSFLEKRPIDFSYSSSLLSSDTIYQNQKVFEKIAHLIGFYRISYDTFSFDSLRFFVENKDTFCEISHLDSMRHTIAIIQYDSLWQVFFNDTGVLESIRKISYGIKEYEKIYPICARKKIVLRKEKGEYLFYKISPTNSFFPNIDTAPQIDFINLKSKFSITIDSSFFQNLFSLEEIPNFSINDSITIEIKLKKDSLKDYLAFLHLNQRFLFKRDNNIFYLKIKPNKEGLNYLTIEILTPQTLFYFKEKFIYHLYQIPIFISSD